MRVAAEHMSGLSFFERLSALDKPDEANDTEQIWMIIRTFLGIIRVLIFVSIIVIAEMLEEIFIGNLSLAVWSLIVGIPLFILLSSSIIIMVTRSLFLKLQRARRLQYCGQLSNVFNHRPAMSPVWIVH